MTREQIKEQVEKLSVVYDKLPISQALFDIWVSSFKDCNLKVFQEAIEETIKNEKYTPNIATVYGYYRQLEEERREMMEKIRSSYNHAVYALNEKKNAEDYKLFLKWLATVPKEHRVKAAENISYEAEKCARENSTAGIPCKSFREILEEC